MPKARDERRERAYKMFKRAGGEKKTTDIARALNVPTSTVRGWKVKDGWEERLEREKALRTKAVRRRAIKTRGATTAARPRATETACGTGRMRAR